MTHDAAASRLRLALGRPVPEAERALLLRMRFHIEPEVSCSRFFGNACFTAESIDAFRDTGDADELVLSEMGEFLAETLHGGLFVDVPCGLSSARDPQKDFDLVPLVQRLGAQRMWEADATAAVMRDRVPDAVEPDAAHYPFAEGPGPFVMRTASTMSITAIQDDLLGLLAKMDPAQMDEPIALYLSGLQPDAAWIQDPEAQRTIAVPYLVALYREIGRVCDAGDLVILNAGDMLVQGIDDTVHPAIHPSVALTGEGFALRRRCAYNKVQVYQKQ